MRSFYYNWATDIHLRAERKAGQLMKEIGEKGERAKGGGDLKKELRLATLSDFGFSKTQSCRWQKLAQMPEEAFEAIARTESFTLPKSVESDNLGVVRAVIQRMSV